MVIQYVPYVKHHDWNTLYTGGGELWIKFRSHAMKMAALAVISRRVQCADKLF